MTTAPDRSDQDDRLITWRGTVTMTFALVVEVGLGWRFGVSPQLPAYLYLGATGVALAAIDAATRRLPDRIVLPSYPIFAAGLTGASLADGRWAALARAVLAMLALGGGYLALGLARPGGLGGGDIKLAGLLGVALGWLAWTAVLTATLTAFALAAAALLGQRLLGRPSPADQTVPFGPYMLTGALVAILVTHSS